MYTYVYTYVFSYTLYIYIYRNHIYMFLDGPEINPTSFRRLNRDWANSHRFPRPWTQKLNKWWTFCWNLMGKIVQLFEEPGKGVTVSGADNMLKVTNELKWIEQMQSGSTRTRERGNPPEWKRKIMGTQLPLKDICDRSLEGSCVPSLSFVDLSSHIIEETPV